MRPAKIKPVNVEESAALKKLYEERVTMSQEKFGEEHGLGTQGMVWQYLNARSPLNLMAAVRFAKALGCDVKDFSPRLAAEQAAVATQAQPPWNYPPTSAC